MDNPNDESDRPNTTIENSDGANTFAMQSKRARRVSFAAEMTSIHFFDRDEEDNATPPVENDSDMQSEVQNEFEDDNEDEDDEEMVMRKSFLRPVGSPSPGGSTFGSASSNDEDNFFGPVSANFIRPGRLSDAASEAASDDNHEFTMDSTAFSMHFRSLARSDDSGIDLKTPAGGRLLFEEKTPSDVGSSMIFTRHKNLIANPSLTATELSEKNDTNDMSLVGENPNNYDYDKLSPGLDALLAESTSNLLSVAVSNDITASSEFLPLTNQEDIPVNRVVSTTSMVIDGANGPRRNERSPRMLSSITSDEASKAVAYRPTSSPYQLSKEVPLVNAVSPVKQQRVLIPTMASPSRHLVMATPLLNQPVSFTESKTHHDSETSIRKSISKLELLEKSASAFSAKVDKSTIRSLNFLRSPNFDALLDSNRHVSRFSLLEDSAANEKLTSVNHSIENKDDFIFWTETPNHVSGGNHLEESFNHITNGKLPNDSPSKVIESGNNSMHGLLTSKHSSDDALVTETDSLLAKIIGGGKETVTPLKFLSSPNIMPEKEILASPGPESNQFEDFLPQNQFKDLLKSEKGGDSTGQMNLVDVRPSTPSVSKDVVSMVMKGELTSPVCEVNHHKNLIEIKDTESREAYNYNEMQIVGTMVNITPDMGKTSQMLHSKIQDAGNKILKELHRNLMELPIAGPSGKEFDDEQVSSIRTPKSIELSGKSEKCSTNKRNIELLLQDTQHRDETAITQKSPKQQKSGISDLDPDPFLCHNQGSSEGTILTTCERKQWIDIYPKIFEDTNQLIPRSAGALSNSKIDVLEDILVHRQRSKAYEVLCSGYQNATAHHDLQLDRTNEMSSLIYQIVIEKAKLQLKHVRRERMLKKLELVGSRIQESQVLKANIPSHLLKANISNIIADQKPFTANLEIEHQIFPENLTAMKQELEAIDRKISNLKRTLHTNCKIKTEPSSETLSLVNEHLMKCAQRKFLHLDMQMWVVHNVSTENGQHSVVLDYLDFVIQSIKVNIGLTPSASTSFKLNETNIVKSFPNIDACKAFAFVFNAQTTCKYVGAKSLALETQITSSILGTLLDVIEEVQLAQMEFSNLIQSNFCSPSVEQLDLMLGFFNFNTGRKVALTLDMSCLKRGIYPSDIIPLQFASNTDIQQDLLSEVIIREIRDGVKGVRSGHTRILRLCRCVSQVVQVHKAGKLFKAETQTHLFLEQFLSQ